MLRIKQFTFNPFGVNTYLIIDTDTAHAIVVDPGMTSSREIKEFDSYIADNNLVIDSVINTHMHLDHCFADNYIKSRYNVDIAANPADAPLGRSIGAQAAGFGLMLPDESTHPVVADTVLHDGDIVRLGRYDIYTLEVPGHSPGSVALYCPDGGFVIVGDVLFKNGIGRTDLPGGNSATLFNSIRCKLFSLPDTTVVLPGHGESTTIGDEKQSNPYIA